MNDLCSMHASSCRNYLFIYMQCMCVVERYKFFFFQILMEPNEIPYVEPLLTGYAERFYKSTTVDQSINFSSIRFDASLFLVVVPSERTTLLTTTPANQFTHTVAVTKKMLIRQLNDVFDSKTMMKKSDQKHLLVSRRNKYLLVELAGRGGCTVWEKGAIQKKAPDPMTFDRWICTKTISARRVISDAKLPL